MILGCGSATPSLRHLPSAQLIEVRGKVFMIDCAEGTQLAMRHTHVAFQKLSAIFISHIHGDHCFGLIGLISTFGLLGRTAPLHVYAPAALRAMLDSQLELFCRDLGYEITFHEVDTTAHKVIYDDRSLTVETLPLCHRVPCAGFLFREKQGLPHIRRDMIDFYRIPLSQINNIKAGADWTTEDGERVANSRLVTPPSPAPSYAYCSDTHYLPDLHKLVSGVSLLYHEATYGEDMRANADKYCHSTARDAALVARDAAVGSLLIGHFSARYNDESVLLSEAKAVFPRTALANERLTIEVKA